MDRQHQGPVAASLSLNDDGAKGSGADLHVHGRLLFELLQGVRHVIQVKPKFHAFAPGCGDFRGVPLPHALGQQRAAAEAHQVGAVSPQGLLQIFQLDQELLGGHLELRPKPVREGAAQLEQLALGQPKQQRCHAVGHLGEPLPQLDGDRLILKQLQMLQRVRGRHERRGHL